MQLINHQIWRDNPDTILLDFLKSEVNITITDILGRIIYVNDQFCEFSGHSKDALLGEVNSLFKSDLHSDPIYKDLWQTIKNGHVWKGVLSDIAPLGNLIWLETIIMPIKNELGRIDKFVAFYVDVTQSSQTNLNIIKKDSKHRKFKASIPKVVLSINEVGEILNINHGIKNFNVNEIIGNSLYLFINPIFRDMVKNIVKLVFEEGKPSQYETMDYNREGHQTFFISQISPVMNKYGRVISATISTQEVDEIQGIEQELIDNEEKYRTLFQSINTGIIVVVDSERNIMEWNKGAELAFGYSEIEMIGQPLTKLIATKSIKNNISDLLKAVKTLDDLDTSTTLEMNGLKKNGTEFPLEFVLSQLKKGNKTYYCAMMLDISKRKVLENKLNTKTKELEQFLYHSAHDLKAPFSSAKGLIDLLREEQLNDKVHGLIDMLETTIEKGKNLSENLIEASIISRKKHKIETINFREMIDQVLIMLNGLPNHSFINFNVEIDEQDRFNSSPKLMNILLQNLIQNAIIYSKKPSKNHDAYIDISININPKDVIISICDNGLGINENSIDKIFDLYYRAHNGDIPGNGLGLYIVKNIVDELKGEIKVISDQKNGTCFELTLPNSNQ